MNKCDKIENIYNIPSIGKTVMISALNGTGIDELLDTIVKNLPLTRKIAELLIPYSHGEITAIFRKDGVIYEEEYREDGVYLKLITDINLLEKYKQYII